MQALPLAALLHLVRACSASHMLAEHFASHRLAVKAGQLAPPGSLLASAGTSLEVEPVQSAQSQHVAGARLEEAHQQQNLAARLGSMWLLQASAVITCWFLMVTCRFRGPVTGARLCPAPLLQATDSATTLASSSGMVPCVEPGRTGGCT